MGSATVHDRPGRLALPGQTGFGRTQRARCFAAWAASATTGIRSDIQASNRGLPKSAAMAERSSGSWSMTIRPIPSSWAVRHDRGRVTPERNVARRWSKVAATSVAGPVTASGPSPFRPGPPCSPSRPSCREMSVVVMASSPSLARWSTVPVGGGVRARQASLAGPSKYRRGLSTSMVVICSGLTPRSSSAGTTSRVMCS